MKIGFERFITWMGKTHDVKNPRSPDFADGFKRLPGTCAADPEETGEMPYGKWQFAFFTPHALPALSRVR
jgi:hypothetical protein